MWHLRRMHVRTRSIVAGAGSAPDHLAAGLMAYVPAPACGETCHLRKAHKLSEHLRGTCATSEATWNSAVPTSFTFRAMCCAVL